MNFLTKLGLMLLISASFATPSLEACGRQALKRTVPRLASRTLGPAALSLLRLSRPPHASLKGVRGYDMLPPYIRKRVTEEQALKLETAQASNAPQTTSKARPPKFNRGPKHRLALATGHPTSLQTRNYSTKRKKRTAAEKQAAADAWEKKKAYLEAHEDRLEEEGVAVLKQIQPKPGQTSNVNVLEKAYLESKINRLEEEVEATLQQLTLKQHQKFSAIQSVLIEYFSLSEALKLPNPYEFQFGKFFANSAVYTRPTVCDITTTHFIEGSEEASFQTIRYLNITGMSFALDQGPYPLACVLDLFSPDMTYDTEHTSAEPIHGYAVTTSAAPIVVPNLGSFPKKGTPKNITAEIGVALEKATRAHHIRRYLLHKEWPVTWFGPLSDDS